MTNRSESPGHADGVQVVLTCCIDLDSSPGCGEAVEAQKRCHGLRVKGLIVEIEEYKQCEISFCAVCR